MAFEFQEPEIAGSALELEGLECFLDETHEDVFKGCEPETEGTRADTRHCEAV